MSPRPIVLVRVVGLLLCGLSGCGREPANSVTGRITLDEKPLADADVTFIPEQTGTSPALGRTDAQGRYHVVQDLDDPNILTGKYVVRITTFQPGNPDLDPPVTKVPERIPVRYNRQSDLLREVKPGENVFDFALDSHGEKYEPRRERF